MHPDGVRRCTSLLNWELRKGIAVRFQSETVRKFTRRERMMRTDRFFKFTGWTLLLALVLAGVLKAPARAGENAAPKRITSGPHGEYEPQWSPDGGRIAFSSDRDGTLDIWVVDAPRLKKP